MCNRERAIEQIAADSGHILHVRVLVEDLSDSFLFERKKKNTRKKKLSSCISVLKRSKKTLFSLIEHVILSAGAMLNLSLYRLYCDDVRNFEILEFLRVQRDLHRPCARGRKGQRGTST